MRHATVHGPGHHHSMHELAVSTAKLMHRPEFWVAVGVLVMLAIVVILTLIQGAPPHPAGWDGYNLYTSGHAGAVLSG